MPGCREIFEKLKSLPPKKVAVSMAFNAALSTVVGCGAGVMGAGVLGLDLKVGAKMGASGNAMFGVGRGFLISVYDHLKTTEIKKEKESKKSFYERVSFFLFSYKTKGEEKEINYTMTLFHFLKYAAEIFVGCFKGYGFLNEPKEYSTTDVAKASAVGVGIEAGILFLIGLIVLITPYCANKLVEAEDVCFGDINYRSRNNGP